ncbi:MAG TPA: cell wall-binding repeat-containing protein [Coriobacteriia bacterium]|jgi:putative cell wall-binding protein
MSRSRSSLIRRSLLSASLLASLLLAAPASAGAAVGSPGPGSWSPKLGYVLTTGSVRAALSRRLHLTPRQDAAIREIGRDLERVQSGIRRRSDLIAMNGSLTAEQKAALFADTGYNTSLASAEDSAAARAAAALGMAPAALGEVVTQVWETDAATHRLETALTTMGLTPQAVVGSFRVYATRFYDEYASTFGVALPDKYVKFANQGNTRAGYPAGLYAVSLYWDGIHRGRDNNQNTAVASPHSVASAKVVDVGPWNVDDNWWNSYSDPLRPRRINNTGIGYKDVASGGGGPDFLARQPHLALGLPESQAAYFNYYARRSPIPPHTTAWENYWDKPRGYGGAWSGSDQFGRQVTQPGAVDLTPPCYAALGLTDNEWIDVVPLWEARLDVIGPIDVTPGPYITGQRVRFTYTLRNLGSLPGTWSSLTFRTTSQDGKNKYSPPQGPITFAPGASRTVAFSQVLDSTGTIVGWPTATRAGVSADLGSSGVTLPNVLKRTVDRIGGDTRYDTAISISRAAYPGTAQAVVITTGLNFPDALAGAALADVEGGPMLLVDRTLPGAVRDEVRRLAPARVFILGSESVVSSQTAAELAAAVPGATVTRLGGWNRYATARLIVQQIVGRTGGGGTDGHAIIATGRDFPDALSASVISAEKHWPILLTDTTRLPTDTAAALAEMGAKSTIVVGGTSVVAPSVLTSLPSPTRVAGADRYATAGLMADLGEANGLSYGYVGLSSGTTYPDALTGGVLAASSHGVMLLTPPSVLAPAAGSRLQAHRTVTTRLQAYGSTSALSLAALLQAANALR